MTATVHQLSAARARKSLVSLGTFPDGLFLIDDDVQFAPPELRAAIALGGNEPAPPPATEGDNSELPAGSCSGDNTGDGGINAIYCPVSKHDTSVLLRDAERDQTSRIASELAGANSEQSK